MPVIRLVHPSSTPNAQVIASDGSMLTTDANGFINVNLGTTVTARLITSLLDAGWHLMDPPEVGNKLPWKTGRFYVGGPGDAYAALLTLATTCYLYPIFIPNPVSLVSVSLFVTTQQASSAGRAALYADNGGVPGIYIPGTDSGSIATTSANAATATYASPIALQPGWYWVATAFTSPGTYPSVSGFTAAMSSSNNALIGADTVARALAVSAAGSIMGLSGTYTFANAFGNNLPALSVINNAGVPAVALGL